MQLQVQDSLLQKNLRRHGTRKILPKLRSLGEIALVREPAGNCTGASYSSSRSEKGGSTVDFLKRGLQYSCGLLELFRGRRKEITLDQHTTASCSSFSEWPRSVAPVSIGGATSPFVFKWSVSSTSFFRNQAGRVLKHWEPQLLDAEDACGSVFGGQGRKGMQDVPAFADNKPLFSLLGAYYLSDGRTCPLGGTSECRTLLRECSSKSAGPQQEIVQEVLISSSSSVGNVIGKQGATIKHIQSLSGCQVETPSTKGKGRKAQSQDCITIRGTQQSVVDAVANVVGLLLQGAKAPLVMMVLDDNIRAARGSTTLQNEDKAEESLAKLFPSPAPGAVYGIYQSAAVNVDAAGTPTSAVLSGVTVFEVANSNVLAALLLLFGNHRIETLAVRDEDSEDIVRLQVGTDLILDCCVSDPTMDYIDKLRTSLSRTFCSCASGLPQFKTNLNFADELQNLVSKVQSTSVQQMPLEAQTVDFRISSSDKNQLLGCWNDWDDQV
ncbi:unnamed protein product [Amoebophrya sp. A25]|nr:unnamed protein product [Amoebophrya sp. A25]|eukprot:GSA25T00016097001.1